MESSISTDEPGGRKVVVELTRSLMRVASLRVITVFPFVGVVGFLGENGESVGDTDSKLDDEGDNGKGVDKLVHESFL